MDIYFGSFVFSEYGFQVSNQVGCPRRAARSVVLVCVCVCVCCVRVCVCVSVYLHVALQVDNEIGTLRQRRRGILSCGVDSRLACMTTWDTFFFFFAAVVRMHSTTLCARVVLTYRPVVVLSCIVTSRNTNERAVTERK